MSKRKYKLDYKETINISGQNYYIRVRSNDKNNRVVLFLHGGCGNPDRAHMIKYQSVLADNFTLVAWDQRGSGLSYNKEESKNTTLSMELYIEDAYRIVKYLKDHFKQQKIIIVGHSFGSILGTWLSYKYPEDIFAYVGVGQCISYKDNELISYNFALEKARQAKDKKAIKTLNKIGAPINGKYSINHSKSIYLQRSVLHKYGGATYSNKKPYWQELLFHELPILLKEYSICGLVKYIKGLIYCVNSPIALEDPDFINSVTELKVPVYLLLGHHDYNCSWELSEQWFVSLKAPYKKLIWFENSAHSPHWEQSQEWNKEFEKLFKS